jgi:bifunctional UDP-N-acetylglucosamine pyrophosphorylase/glucosamine-1-phosphate N-acetyltransferase
MSPRKTTIRPVSFPSPRPREVVALVLAAGIGKRMLSRASKVVHPIAGRPMVRYVVDAALEAGVQRVLVVVGPQSDEVRLAIGNKDKQVSFCVQEQPLGTGHAVLSAQKALKGSSGTLLILNGDLPSLKASTLTAFLEHHSRTGAPLTLLTATVPDPGSYGRIVRNYSADVARIVEASDANPEERQIQEINCGIYCAEIDLLYRYLKQAGPDNVQKEIYLTQLVEILRRNHRKVAAYQHADAEEVLGVNNREELARAGKTLFRRKARELMHSGVTIVDPDCTYVETPVRIGRDTILYPMVHLEGATVVGESCRIGTGTRISDSVLGDEVEVLNHCVITRSRIGKKARVGPFAHLRPESDLAEGARIGNFVETKNSRIGTGSKANHLAYLGDAEIGSGVNVGAGTITCNYDGEKKHRTVLEDEVFIGSDSQLVAPVRVRKGAYVGAGSTITKEVPPYALALARGRQINVENWVKSRRSRNSKPRKKKPKKS